MAPQDDTEQHEGMSTRKKLAAGAALGVAVPTVVGVARKLMSSTGDTAEDTGRATAGGVHHCRGSYDLRAGSSRPAGPHRQARSGSSCTSSAGRSARHARRGMGRARARPG